MVSQQGPGNPYSLPAETMCFLNWKKKHVEHALLQLTISVPTLNGWVPARQFPPLIQRTLAGACYLCSLVMDLLRLLDSYVPKIKWLQGVWTGILMINFQWLTEVLSNYPDLGTRPSDERFRLGSPNFGLWNRVSLFLDIQRFRKIVLVDENYYNVPVSSLLCCCVSSR